MFFAIISSFLHNVMNYLDVFIPIWNTLKCFATIITYFHINFGMWFSMKWKPPFCTAFEIAKVTFVFSTFFLLNIFHVNFDTFFGEKFHITIITSELNWGFVLFRYMFQSCVSLYKSKWTFFAFVMHCNGARARR